MRYALFAYLVALAAGVALVLTLSHRDLRLGVGVLGVDAAMLATLVPLYRSRRLLRARDLGLRPTPPARSVWLVFLGFYALGVCNLVWFQGLLGRPPARLSVTLHEGTAAAVLTGFAGALCAPVIEEIFFRGLLYRSLRNRMGVLPAVLVGGALFGLVHWTTYPLATLPPKMIFGVVACLLYEHTKSLYPGMALHVLIDAGAFEIALTGHNHVIGVFLGIGVLVLVYSAVRRGRWRRSTDSRVTRLVNPASTQR